MPRGQKRPRVSGYPAALSASDDDIDAAELPIPSNYVALTEAEIREFNKMSISRIQRADHATLFALLMEIARVHYPEIYAIMCSRKMGPLIQAPRRDPATQDQLSHMLFGQLLRLQGTLNIDKAGEFPWPSLLAYSFK